MQTEQALQEEAARFRAALESLAQETDAGILRDFPRGCCKTASFLLAIHLAHRGCAPSVSYEWGVRGPSGATLTHGWLRVDGYIVDITADQFEDSPGRVIVRRCSGWHTKFRSRREFPYSEFTQFNDETSARFARWAERLEALLAERATAWSR